MYCKHCGAAISENEKFCKECGGEQSPQKIETTASKEQSLVGFSQKINDPAFDKYIKNNNRWSAIFSIVLAAVAVIGFFIAGEVGADGMKNPQAIFIGLGVGGIFMVIALFQVLSRKRSTTWDGTIENKETKKKTERHTYGEDDVSYEDYLEYSVIIRSDCGKKVVLKAKNDDTLYNYYSVGDKIRHHAQLDSYEKYDKTGDTFIPCIACATICDIKDDYCFRCKCPLLK